MKVSTRGADQRSGMNAGPVLRSSPLSREASSYDMFETHFRGVTTAR